MLNIFRLVFNGASEPVKGTLNEVKDEALSTFRFYKNVITVCVVLFGGFMLLGMVALLKVIFGG